jgi:hypothetical protein
MYSAHDAKTSAQSSVTGAYAVGAGVGPAVVGPAVVGAGVGPAVVGAGVGAAVGAGVGRGTGAAVGLPGATDGRRVGAALTRQMPQERSQ